MDVNIGNIATRGKGSTQENGNQLKYKTNDDYYVVDSLVEVVKVGLNYPALD